ncbi:hypothetical protein LUW75_21965 [Streptomyces sp. MRC013]|uniref:hypothetical protein n=1 Tax=Streptomyces sp. MRC013 TaxID=2898276 RepID=UPI00202760F0|nr:hypothetical protein [Streptomyces sp. MRC013]URM92175.1 hypothetical protein LUW75_21965 [Streptomyces sp. MRC013]
MTLWHPYAPTHQAEATYLASVITARVGAAPVVVDLTTGPYEREEFSVVKVCAPHLRYSSRHTIPRPRLEASA